MDWYPGISRQDGLSNSLLVLVLVLVQIFLHILKNYYTKNAHKKIYFMSFNCSAMSIFSFANFLANVF